MLKSKRGISACSLSSCRIRAEALARAFNSRIWPCTWVDHRRRTGDSEDEDEEYFEASPVEDVDQQHQGRDSSAATEQGRAKLYELLQQHVTDDAIEVFYDVSENTENEAVNPSIEDGFEEVKLNDPNCVDTSVADSSSENVDTANLTNGVEEVKSSDPCSRATSDGVAGSSNENVNEASSRLTNGECDISPLDSSQEIAMKSYPNGNLMVEAGVVNDRLNISSFENEEIMSVTIDSDAFNSHQIEFHQVDLSTQQNLISDVSVCGDKSFQVESESPNQESENASKDGDDSVSIKITKTCKSTHETDGVSLKQVDDEHLSADDAEVNNKCRLKVFTELRPMITRSTSLKTGKTPPGTPSRKKIVRFADVLGLDLEDVRHIISGDLPNIPSSAYSDLVLPDEDLPSQTAPSVTLEFKSRQQGPWESVRHNAVGPNTIYPLFAIPGEQPDFMDKVRTFGICLESVIISDFNVQCTCRVMNWGFRKKVVARYSVDNWTSSSDINASYVSGSTRDGTDSFAFNIYLSPHQCNVEFALRFEVNDKEYWDNNSGKNYRLDYHGNGNTVQSAVPISPTWMDQFW